MKKLSKGRNRSLIKDFTSGTSLIKDSGRLDTRYIYICTLCIEVLKSGSPIFFSGTKDKAMKNLPRNAHVLSAIDNLKVVDTVIGARLESECGDTVFTLIPREYAIEKLTHVNKTLRSLYALDGSRTKAEVRGKKRVTVAEDGGNYITVGLKPNS